MIRSAGLFIIAPILSQRTIPAPVKVGLSILLAIVIMMTLPVSAVPAVSTLGGLVGVAFLELFVGAIIGFMLMIVILAAEGAGSVIGYQVGFALANALDPITRTQTSLIGTFWVLVSSLIFLAINGHYMIIQAFHDSYTLVPPGQVALNGPVGEAMIRYTAYLFVVALKIAAPVMVTLFLVDVALGTVAKMMPNMNVFFVGFPIKIAAGLAVIALSLPIFSYVIRQSLGYLNTELGVVLAALKAS